MTSATRPLTDEEQEVLDDDERLPFGHFAPNALQRNLIALAKGTMLHRGAFRRTMTNLIMGTSDRPLDVTFRDCAFRLRGSSNLIEFGILLNPRYNDSDIDFLLADASPGSVFVDVGSNIGLYTLPLAKRAGPLGKVVAIDANRLMARRLAWNAAASGLSNVEIFPCAVSDREGMGSLSIRKEDIAIVSVEDGLPGSIPIRTLPSILQEAGVQRIDGLKIDIEGHEDRALAPFIETAEDEMLPRRIVIERPDRNEEYPACAAAFLRRGYRLQGRSRNNSFFARD